MTILLASCSSRRKALLEQVGFRENAEFYCAGVQAVFDYHDKKNSLTLSQVEEKIIAAAGLKVSRAAGRDSLYGPGLSPEETVLVGAQTIVFHDGLIMERPLSGDPREATAEEFDQAVARSRQMLRRIRGKQIAVLTGLVCAQGDIPTNQRTVWVMTQVKMKGYSDKDIEAYITTGEGFTMAGGVDLLEQGVVLCERIKGSYSNIGGLPLAELMKLLLDPLFANRIRFRLSEPDRGKYSVAVREGPQRLKIVSLGNVPDESNAIKPEIDQIDVLHVPGIQLIDETKREIALQLMKRARQAGQLVVLDGSRDVKRELDRPTFLDLVRYKVDVLLAEETTNRDLTRLMFPRLLLASQSPRRRELLKQIVAANMIEVMVSQQDESYLDEEPEVRVKRLAIEKARAVLAQEQAYSPSIEIVIGADTEVVLDGKALGKPADEEEAWEQLRRLEGRTHEVITGIGLISTRSDQEIVDIVSTRVKFKELSPAEIETYIESEEPMGKAGAYGIQSKGALFVEAIDGSYSNVVGLPLERLSQILDRQFGLPVWQLGPVYGRRMPGLDSRS